MTNNTVTLTFWNADGDEISVEVSSKWEICECCHGEGRTDNPAFADGIPAEEWNHEWDYEEREAYMSGAYDVRCDECDGTGKVRSPNLDELSEEQRKDYDAYLEEKYYNDREREAERRWGF